MSTRVPSRGSDQFNLRFPDGLRDQIAQAAQANGRSMNAEIIARLLHTLPVAGNPQQLSFFSEDVVRELAKEVAKEALKEIAHEYPPTRFKKSESDWVLDEEKSDE